ncbi:glycine oxidase ThiO [Synechocystis sp. LEGE 06083]|nr:glycine oxidase ThiO [Synechocystis sp. LEGE 06083]
MQTTSDVLIIGGGIIGLAIAVELKLKQRQLQVTVLSRDFAQAASHAAAGMLAPHAEQIAPGPMLELCLASRWRYGEWVEKLAQLTGMETGYNPCGILSPVFEAPHGNAPNISSNPWLDRETIRHYQPGLGEDVVGGWWHPDDGQVDNRKLISALRQAAQSLGVRIQEGVTVQAIAQRHGQATELLTDQGSFQADTYVLANGSWAKELLPLPVFPVKGQMMALRMPAGNHQPYPLQRVLFGPQTYLVPRRDGRLIVGATSERVDWEPHNTPQGIQTLLSRAIRLFPALADWAIEDFWWGFRPGTPDELPFLGYGPCDNLVLAIGHYRNGILLAPITATLISDLILDRNFPPLIKAFSPQRFSTPKPPVLPCRPMTAVFPSVANPSLPHAAENVVDSEDLLEIAGRKFHSRLMTGTGKYPSLTTMQDSVASSGCQIVTVAVRRVQTNAPGHEGLAEAIDWSTIWMLPNTAGCQTAEEAIRVARLGREMAKLLGQEDNNFIKLEVIPDTQYLLPDPIGTLEAAEQLVKEGFAVLPYINADPLLAKRLEEVGCATVMPLGSPIGSGQGIRNAANIAIIIENAKVPVVVDAGIGTPSEAAQAMEMGADAVLINSAIAMAANPVAMAQAMGMATQAGRLAYLSGRMPIKNQANASSPLTGLVS